jgi:endoglucanase
MFSNPLPRRRTALIAVSAAVAVGQLALGSPASAATAPTAATATAPLPAGTTFYVPAPDQGAKQQIAQLKSQHRPGDAALVQAEVDTPQAVWFTDADPKGTGQAVHRTVTQARAHKTVPTLVAYNVPGRDCSQYSAGGAATDAEYRAWADGFASGLTRGQLVTVVVEPDGLSNLPSDCSSTDAVLPGGPEDTSRIADIKYLGEAVMKADPAARVYLDSGNSAWHSVADSASRLAKAGVAEFAGFSLNVSNYQYSANSAQYGTWISDCLALHPDAATTTPGDCGDQYYAGGPANGYAGITLDAGKQWSNTAADPTANTSVVNDRYARLLAAAGVTPTARFVVDTSRNGRGPWASTAYADDQDWCNPPGRGLGARPQASPDAAFPMLDAYLWIKTPGQSDGQCNRNVAGSTTDPEWGGITDPAAGAWFPEQALQLAQLAVPALR